MPEKTGLSERLPGGRENTPPEDLTGTVEDVKRKKPPALRRAVDASGNWWEREWERARKSRGVKTAQGAAIGLVGLAALARGAAEIVKAVNKKGTQRAANTPLEAWETNDAQLAVHKAFYLEEGYTSPALGNEPLSDPNLVNSSQALDLAAEAGGPTWLVPLDDKGRLPPTAPLIAKKLNEQLIGTTQEEILQNYRHWHDNPQEFLDFLSQHGAHPTVVNFFRCVIDVAAKSSTPETWQDRIPAVEACAVAAKATSTTETKPPGQPSLVPIIGKEGGETNTIALRIIQEGIQAEASVASALFRPALEIAQRLVVNHHVPLTDDVQGWLNTAIEAGDQLVGYIQQLPRELKQAVDNQIHQWTEARQQHQDNLPPDYISQTPTEAINRLTGGAGWPMAVILGLEVGLVIINSARYLKREKEMRGEELPTPEQMRNKAIDLELNLKVEQARVQRRGLPRDHIRVGYIRLPGLFGIGSERVGAEIFMDAELVREEVVAYQDLVSTLRQGVSQAAINALTEKGLLITKTVRGTPLKVAAIRAQDLINITQELEMQRRPKGRIFMGQVDWYGGEKADYRMRKHEVIKPIARRPEPKAALA